MSVFILFLYLSASRQAEYGLIWFVRWAHHSAGVPGGKESPGLFGSQGAAADESQQQPQWGTQAASERGRKWKGALNVQRISEQKEVKDNQYFMSVDWDVGHVKEEVLMKEPKQLSRGIPRFL